jgi:hypothetical protein
MHFYRSLSWTTATEFFFRNISHIRFSYSLLQTQNVPDGVSNFTHAKDMGYSPHYLAFEIVRYSDLACKEPCAVSSGNCFSVNVYWKQNKV